MVNSQVSQDYVEALSIPTSTAVDITQSYAEALSIPTSTPRELTQSYVEVLARMTASQETQVYAEALTVPTAVPRDLTQAYVEALSPNGVQDQTGLMVELLINGVWADISPYVFYESKVRIVRGKPNEASQIQPQTATLTINNRDGRFSPRNPLGPYYGYLGRNTPIRISRSWMGTRYYRFYGEVPAWPTTWDISGQDVRVPIIAAGQMRRLFQGNQPLRSAMYRAYGLGLGIGTPPVAYWPCEDGTNSTQIASGLSGGRPMLLSGPTPPTFASNASFPSSLPIPLLSGSTWTGAVPSYTGGTSNALGLLMSVPAGGAPDGSVLVRIYTSGTVARMELVYGTTGGGSLAINGYDSFGNPLFASGYQSPTAFTGYGFTGYNGMPVFVDMILTQSGGTVNWEGDFIVLYPRTGLQTSFGISAGSLAGLIGAVTSVVINPNGSFTDTAVGHVIFQTSANFTGNVGAPLNGWITEPPVLPFIIGGGTRSNGRFLRLCAEQNVTAATITASGVYAGDTGTMGYQLNDTFANLIQQPATTNAGLLFESRTQNALVLRERNSLYNQSAALTLDISQHQLSGPMPPVDDDAFTRNDVTATRINGSSLQLQQTTGPLSIQAPPNGVGDYATTYDVSVGADSQLPDQAGWRLHLGTVDQPRYPQIPINLRHSTFTGTPAMMVAALTTDIGDRLVVVNPPSWMPPDPISQIALGYTEALDQFSHDMVFNCAPEDPYRIGILDDTVLGHLDTDGSTLAVGAGSAATSLTVATTSNSTPSWTTNAADFPFDIAIGGERITVTAIAAASFGLDGTFETGVSGWSTANGTVAQSSAQAHTGTYSALITSTITSGQYSIFTPSRFPLQGGAVYIFSHWMRLASGAPTAEWGFINCYDGGGTYVGTVLTGNVDPAAYWVNQTVRATIPAGTVTGQLFIQATSGTIGDAFYADDITLTLAGGGQQVFTVTRSVNGVVKAQNAGSDVRLWQPMTLSM